MATLIGLDDKYYCLKDECKMCTVIYDKFKDKPEVWSLCTKCGHLYCKKDGCKCNHEINFYSRKEEYGWLSNFWRSEQKMSISNDSYYIFPTNEHYYQAEKAKDDFIKWWIRRAPTPYLAMITGRALRPHEIVDNWENKKVEVMLTGLRAKFTQSEELKQKLLDTGNAILHEDSPTDMFWGKKGRDMLGVLLMQVRDEIRDA